MLSLSEINLIQKYEYNMISLLCSIQKMLNSLKQRVEWWLPGSGEGGRENEVLFVKGYKASILQVG